MNRQTTTLNSLFSHLGADALASVVVFLVALPLCMGIALASGVPIPAGIITGIVGGIAVGAIAGSPLQVSGPAAGLTVLVWEIVHNPHIGLGLLGIVVLLAGLLQVAAGIFKLGQWFRAVSPAVIHGMLAGIGVLIFSSQFHVMLDSQPIGKGFENLVAIPGKLYQTFIAAEGSGHLAALMGLLTIAVIALWTAFAPKKLKIIPGALVAVIVAIVVAAVFQLPIKYVEIPDNIWSEIQWPNFREIGRIFSSDVLIAAASIAFIASAETLLCATAVDQMHQGQRTKYDQELTAQGVGNALCGLLGALPMTGVIVRSSANVQAGGKTKLSAIFHGIWLLIFISVIPWTLKYIPLAALAAILVYTGYKLAYPKIVWTTLLNYGHSEAYIYFATVISIVATNLLEGVLIGLGLSILKLLYDFSHLEIRQSEDLANNRTDLHLTGTATLIRLPKLAAVLEQLRPNTEVHVHIEHLNYIDHACLDLMMNWERQHEATGGNLVIEWDELSWKYHQRRRGATRAAME